MNTAASTAQIPASQKTAQPSLKTELSEEEISVRAFEISLSRNGAAGYSDARRKERKMPTHTGDNS